jgi:hypothetical protein
MRNLAIHVDVIAPQITLSEDKSSIARHLGNFFHLYKEETSIPICKLTINAQFEVYRTNPSCSFPATCKNRFLSVNDD